MKLFFTLFFIIGSFQYVDNDLTRRIISDDDFNYIFFISDKNISSHKDFKEYHWFKKGKIHFSFGGSDGRILHGEYKKTYRNNGLAEQGVFNLGLKVKDWKSWYQNGKVDEIVQWNDGLKSGKYQKFNASGKLVLTGKFKNSRKHGTWIDHEAKDTLYFKKGERVFKEEIAKVEETESKGAFAKTKRFFKNLFKKKSTSPKNATKVKNTENKSFFVKTKEFFKGIFKKKTAKEKDTINKNKEVKKKQKELERKRKELASKKAANKENTSKKQ